MICDTARLDAEIPRWHQILASLMITVNIYNKSMMYPVFQGQMGFGDGAQYSGGWLHDARHGYGSYRLGCWNLLFCSCTGGHFKCFARNFPSFPGKWEIVGINRSSSLAVCRWKVSFEICQWTWLGGTKDGSSIMLPNAEFEFHVFPPATKNPENPHRLPNGSCYDGDFKADIPEGAGKLHDADVP